jgi:hypothetical protein
MTEDRETRVESLTKTVADQVNHPTHYTSHKSGVEAIRITRHMGFSLGNAFKYIFRRGKKDEEPRDIAKAIWYVRDAIVAAEKDEDEVTSLMLRVANNESLGMALAMTLIYSADLTECKKARSSMLQQALALLEQERDRAQV